MSLLSWLGISKPRDAPSLPDIRDNVRDSGNLFVFGMTHSGERVDERTAIQCLDGYMEWDDENHEWTEVHE